MIRWTVIINIPQNMCWFFEMNSENIYKNHPKNEIKLGWCHGSKFMSLCHMNDNWKTFIARNLVD